METKLASGNLFKMIAVALLAFALALVALTQPAFADESSSAAAASSSAASAAAASDSAAAATTGKPTEAVDPIRGGLPMMGNDYVWFGRDLELSNGEVANDIIAAGQIVNIKKTKAVGDFRIAAQDISIKDSSAGQNITVAGETVSIHDTIANAVAAAGRTVYVGGSCDELSIYGETVYVDGVVNGDVVVGANTVEVGPNARIMGTLHVSASTEPVMDRGAEVADVDFTKSESSSYSSAEIESTLAGLSSMIIMLMIVMSIIGTFVVALLAEWLFPRQTVGAVEMIRNRTGATIGTGIVGALVAPIAVILLICLGVTLPVAGGVAFALFAITSVACGFAGASLFKLVFKNMGRFKCAMLGGAIVGVASAIPFLGSLVSAAAFMYLLGYVLQSIFLGMREPAPTLTATSAAPAQAAQVQATPAQAAQVQAAPVTPAPPTTPAE